MSFWRDLIGYAAPAIGTGLGSLVGAPQIGFAVGSAAGGAIRSGGGGGGSSSRNTPTQPYDFDPSDRALSAYEMLMDPSRNYEMFQRRAKDSAPGFQDYARQIASTGGSGSAIANERFEAGQLSARNQAFNQFEQQRLNDQGMAGDYLRMHYAKEQSGMQMAEQKRLVDQQYRRNFFQQLMEVGGYIGGQVVGNLTAPDAQGSTFNIGTGSGMGDYGAVEGVKVTPDNDLNWGWG